MSQCARSAASPAKNAMLSQYSRNLMCAPRKCPSARFAAYVSGTMGRISSRAQPTTAPAYPMKETSVSQP